MRIHHFLALGLLIAACTPERDGDATTGAGGAGTSGAGATGGVNASGSGGSHGGASGFAGNGAPDASVDMGSGGVSGSGGTGGEAGAMTMGGAAGTGNRAGAAGAGGAAGGGPSADVTPDFSLDGDLGDASFSDADANGYVCADAGAYKAACGCALCGNGQVDKCPIVTTGFSGEGCDGLDLAGTTCESLGYASGQARCAPNCVVEVFACESCVISADLPLCRHPFDYLGSNHGVSGLALAANGTELGLVWLTHEFEGTVPNVQRGATRTIRWARLAADLSVIAESTLTPPPPFLPGQTVGGAALLATSAGWMFAFGTNGHIHILMLDASGAIVSSRDVGEGSSPNLVGRDGGGPLLIFNKLASGTRDTQWFTLLGPDGTEAVAPAQITDAMDFPEAAGVFVGDGFLVSQFSQSGFRIARIELTGQIAVVTTQVPPSRVSLPSLVWDGTFARLVYSSIGDTFWQRVESSGQLSGSPVALSLSTVKAVGIPPSSTETIVLGNWLQSMRVDAAGAVLHGPVTVSTGETSSGHRLAPLGKDLFAAWYDSGGTRYPGNVTVTLGSRITVARINP
jgi:hypothetical protein